MSRNQRPFKPEVQLVTGYILAEADQGGDSDDDSDVDDDEEWLDNDQMSAVALGGNLVKQNSVKLRRVTIKELKAVPRSYICKGRFPLLDPWWKVRCHIYPINRSNVYSVDHTRPIINEIRTDKDVVEHKLLMLFLRKILKTTELSVKQQTLYLDAFERFTKEQNVTQELYFNKLEELCKRFDDVSEHYQVERLWKRHICQSEELKLVKSAVDFSELFLFLSQLRPKYFISVFQSTSRATWEKLDKCREDFPWEFGFSTIMYKQYGLIGFEATLVDFLRVGVLEEFPAVYQDALYIYDLLKQDARQNGHTYIDFTRIKFAKFLNGHRVVNWSEALKFLQQHAIVKTEGEKLSPDMKIFLKRNWQAEKDVAKCLSRLVARRADTSWTVDFSSDHFDTLHTDPDQWRAAHLVLNSPVAVLSGKGGCGKTTVVTELLKYVCTHCEKEDPETQRDQETDQDDDNSFNQSESREPSVNQSECMEASFDQSPDTELNMAQPMKSQLNKSPWKSQREMNEEKDDDEEDDSDDDDNDKYLSKTTIGQTILLTAPTGKAANLLGKKAHMDSCTLHHVIMSFKGFCKRKAEYLHTKNKSGSSEREEDGNSSDQGQEEENDSRNRNRELPQEEESSEDSEGLEEPPENRRNDDSESFEELPENRRNDNSEGLDDCTESSTKEPIKPKIDPEMPTWKYENISVLVVDECSLVSVRTIATALRNLQSNACLSKVVLLGDVRQLPSVEPGNFLVDIFRVLSPMALCVELRTNHRAESELIVRNATRISLRKLPDYENGKFQLVEVDMKDGDTEIDEKIRELLETSADLHQETSQFVSFQRKRCESINELCCKFYNNHVTRDGKRKLDFRLGDKVCMSKNAEVLNYKSRLPSKRKVLYNSLVGTSGSRGITGARMETLDKTKKMKKKKKKGNKKIKLCNGEVFFIVEDVTETENNGKANRYITLSDKEKPNEKLICVNFRDLIKKCRMRHGWARTIHTYQGSESSSVVYVVYKSYHENWQHVYTAVTRGRNSVYMVGKKCIIDKAITTNNKDRRTSLQQKLVDTLKGVPDVLQEIKSQLLSLLEKSDKERKEKSRDLVEEVEGETDVWEDCDDWSDEDLEALCQLLPEEEEFDMPIGSTASGKGHNSSSHHSGMPGGSASSGKGNNSSSHLSDNSMEAMHQLSSEDDDEEEGLDWPKGSTSFGKGHNSSSDLSDNSMDTSVGESEFNPGSVTRRNNLSSQQNTQSNLLSELNPDLVSDRYDDRFRGNNSTSSSSRNVRDCERKSLDTRATTYTSITRSRHLPSTTVASFTDSGHFVKGDNSDSIVKGNNSYSIVKGYNSDSVKGDNPESIAKGCNSDSIAKGNNSNYMVKGDNVESWTSLKEDKGYNDSFFDSDDSYIRTLDESGMILCSQLAEKSNRNLSSLAVDEDDDLFDDADWESLPNDSFSNSKDTLFDADEEMSHMSASSTNDMSRCSANMSTSTTHDMSTSSANMSTSSADMSSSSMSRSNANDSSTASPNDIATPSANDIPANSDIENGRVMSTRRSSDISTSSINDMFAGSPNMSTSNPNDRANMLANISTSNPYDGDNIPANMSISNTSDSANSTKDNSSANTMKRRSTSDDDCISPGKTQCVGEMSMVSPVRQSLHKTLNFS